VIGKIDDQKKPEKFVIPITFKRKMTKTTYPSVYAELAASL
jgi:hypothetical protein